MNTASNQIVIAIVVSLFLIVAAYFVGNIPASVEAQVASTLTADEQNAVRACLKGVSDSFFLQNPLGTPFRTMQERQQQFAGNGFNSDEVFILRQILNCDPRTELIGTPIDGFSLSAGPIFFFETITQNAFIRGQQIYAPSSVPGIVDATIIGGLNGLIDRSVTTTVNPVFDAANPLSPGGIPGGIPGGGIPFGGFVSFVEWCSCSGNAIVTVGPPRGGRFLYQPGATQVFEFFQIPRVGVWLLGNYSPGSGVCLQGAGKICIPIPHQGTITIVGTSL